MNRCAILLCAFIVIGLEKAEAASFPIVNFAFSQELSHGTSGNEVSELQSALMDMGYAIPSIESGRVRKGYFGLETQAALKIYQRGVGLPETGVLDEMTRMYMNEGVTYGTSIPLNTNAPIAPSAPATSTVATSTEPVPQDTEVEINITSPGDINSLQKGKFQEISWSFEDHGKFSSTSTPQVDIHLIADAPQASTSAPFIASGIDARRGSYPWQAGNVFAFGAGTSTRPTAVPDGKYLLEICLRGDMPVCDSSDAPFTLYSNVGIQSPGITTVSGPTSVPINKSATWTIYAHDPQNQQLSFVVSWDDGTIVGFTPSDAEQNTALSQGIQVSHTYTEARTYNPSFKVINTSGLSTVNSMAVYSKHGE